MFYSFQQFTSSVHHSAANICKIRNTIALIIIIVYAYNYFIWMNIMQGYEPMTNVALVSPYGVGHQR